MPAVCQVSGSPAGLWGMTPALAEEDPFLPLSLPLKACSTDSDLEVNLSPSAPSPQASDTASELSAQPWSLCSCTGMLLLPLLLGVMLVELCLRVLPKLCPCRARTEEKGSFQSSFASHRNLPGPRTGLAQVEEPREAGRAVAGGALLALSPGLEEPIPCSCWRSRRFVCLLGAVAVSCCAALAAPCAFGEQQLLLTQTQHSKPQLGHLRAGLQLS